jgi:hypothetical protein
MVSLPLFARYNQYGAFDLDSLKASAAWQVFQATVTDLLPSDAWAELQAAPKREKSGLWSGILDRLHNDDKQPVGVYLVHQEAYSFVSRIAEREGMEERVNTGWKLRLLLEQQCYAKTGFKVSHLLELMQFTGEQGAIAREFGLAFGFAMLDAASSAEATQEIKELMVQVLCFLGGMQELGLAIQPPLGGRQDTSYRQALDLHEFSIRLGKSKARHKRS